MQTFVELSVDSSAHFTNRVRARAKRVDDLLLSLHTMRNVLVDERNRVIACRPMTGKNAPRISLTQFLERANVVGHVAVGRKNRRGAFAKDRVAGEEIAVGSEIADVLGRVSWRGDDFEPFDDLAAARDVVRFNSFRSDDSRACQALEWEGRGRVIGVAMGDEDLFQPRHRLTNRFDVRIDRRTGIDDREIIDEIRARPAERKRAGIRSHDVSNLHGKTIFPSTIAGRVVGISALRRDSISSAADRKPTMASRFFSVGKTTGNSPRM